MSAPPGWPFCRVLMKKPSWRVSSSVIVAMVGLVSRFWLKCLNNVKCHNLETLHKYTEHRPDGVPLVTVTNHQSCLDDPLLWGLLSMKVLLSRQKQRWSLAAKELIFTNELFTYFFCRGKTIPTVRGDGVYQIAVDFALEELNQGHWVHIFPEGKVVEDGSLIRLKWGVGRLIAESQVTPIVLPFWHVGMDDVLPNKTPYIPQIMKKVTVLVGEPVTFDDIISDYRRRKSNAMETRKRITDKIEYCFKDLKKEADALHSKWTTNQ